ncbi:hypothetical protein [Candidatus Promineifilum breve]|uniref:hypothetical protein n=1 Tax=Candidatus Promineifilum breve TaxID=1806508 RepID=UPI000BA28F0F|nr:hypothetical protein [Candidatus Promineifilum breve]
MKKIEPIPWRGIRVVEIVIALVLFLAALAVMALPFVDAVIARRLARITGGTNAMSWLINDRGTWIVGAALLGLLVVFLFLVRRRLLNNRALWFGAGCPDCMERELVRVSRKGSDRVYSLIALPAFRYACRNCTWRGLRIARREQSRERDAELEAALLRFEPDGEAPLLSPDGDESQRAQIALAPVTGSGSMFRDPGDVAFLDEPRLQERFDDDDDHDDDLHEDDLLDDDLNDDGSHDDELHDDDLGDDSNHEAEAEAEPIQEMEWLWPSPPEA